MKKLQFYLLQQKYCEPLEEKPRIQDCAGFWLKFELEDYEMDDPIQGVLRVIDSVNKETRLLRVKLLAIDPTTGNVMASYKDISYDHPDISIHKVNIPPEILAANAVAARDEFRPKLEDAAKGYFVIYTGDGSEMHEQMGKVLASDVKDRTLKVGFHPMNGDFTKGQVRTIPYDHPYLFWSKDGKLVKPEITEEKALIPSKAKIPDNVKQTIGYRVEVQSHEPDAEPGDTFPGIVVGYNEKSKMIKVSFDTTNNPNEDCEEIFWEKDEIAWMKEPKTEKRKAPMLIPETVEECIGYVVNVREVVPDTEEVDSIMLPGKIISGDKENDTVCVRFDGSTDEEPDDVYYSRTSTDIQYALAPKHSKLLQITARPPNTLVDAVARDVRIWQVSEDQEHAAVWTGKIFSVNVANNSALVLYEKGSGTPGGSEDVLWGSDSFIWITKNSIGKEEIIQNKHPDNIGDAVGYEVQIKSSEPDAEDGDMFAGKIISIDRAKCTVKVLFDSDANDEVEQDTEDVPFESTDIYWVKAPLVVDPVKLDLRRDFSVSRYPNRVQSTGDRPVVRRPNTITAVGGWNVSVRCDDGMEYTGEILSVNAAKSIVSVVFNTTTQVKSEADLEVEDIPFDSPIIVWHGKLSSSNNEEDEKDTEENEKAKKPSITDCVGWYVYIQDEDGELLGRVTDFNLNEEIILVIFYDEDGILDTEDVQQLPYNKEPMLWYENLEDAYRKK